ncbi:YjbQ family protein [Algibacter amylolyticus]|uniref:YjbQ family protein n=1 Tax=Algibacter amylolyticus TaxID=1608400 RepID=A0A5M7B4S4_9FLAO|nr:secondary thiamine-phosphate synthase enzyme YjbQ [Algibacter amylolyticus]KAA5824379.1 YjbQ family protein [Algibacter amylolyticus]MBB5269564.1 secondary thiamine-phosphate synthase enzyme [Algibacter amylolyticus]TSJ75152.1 YjbQ family protein [Algibacter amylolyticus]
MKWFQKELKLKVFSRGFHLITDDILHAIPEIKEIKIGQMQVFIKHTSASLTINENADFTVRLDFESHFNKLVPENAPYYKHTYEGPDDMPAHIKASLLSTSVQIPVTNGTPNLGVWQGIYLCEHRDYGGSRNLVITVYGT